MENMQRRTFPTTVKTAPTEAELDRMLFELVKDTLGGYATEADPETRRIPTDAELRASVPSWATPYPPATRIGCGCETCSRR